MMWGCTYPQGTLAHIAEEAKTWITCIQALQVCMFYMVGTATHGCLCCTLLQVFSILAGRIAEAAESAAQAAAAAEEATQQLKQQQQQQDTEMAGEGEEQQQQQQQDEQPAAEDVAAAAAAKAEAARQLVLAQVRGFSMSFRSQVVQLGLTGRVMQAVEQQGLAPDMRAALLGPLGLA